MSWLCNYLLGGHQRASHLQFIHGQTRDTGVFGQGALLQQQVPPLDVESVLFRHQVILLATDTELDANVQTELAPFVAAEYEISYDSKAHGSQLSRRASRPEQPSHLEVT